LQSGLKDGGFVARIATEIRDWSRGASIRIMHVCGTHEWTITHSGIRDLLPDNVQVVAGPGCPVCVTPSNEIDALAELSLAESLTVTTFGDLLRVPGNRTSLSEAKASGGDIRVVYSVADAIRMAKENPSREVVHFSIGFETTAPMTAVEIVKGLPSNFSVFATHKLIPPAMDFLLNSGAKLDGFICPGHVSTIIGLEPYKELAEEHGKPMVISGFEPMDVMLGILNIVKQVKEGTHLAVNGYRRAVRDTGNEVALSLMKKAFEVRDAHWRGIGIIGSSGLGIRQRYKDHDATVKYKMESTYEDRMPKGCSCGEVLLGNMIPEECPLFGDECKPDHPIGPCMVSFEGSCAIVYKFKRL